MGKIIAVVVTFNRLSLLTECILALKNQSLPVDKILIINNGSTDETESWLKKQKGIDFITQENTGSGGGFNAGIRASYEQGYDWIWLMDDDGYPKFDALENLLEDDLDEMCLRNCAVINKDDRKTFVWKTGKYQNIDDVKVEKIKNYAHPFNGTMLHRKIVERVGLPKKELFIWGDETEYYHRIISKNKIPFYTKTNSIHYHPASNYSYKSDWNFYTNWKMYYYVRNRLAILKTKYSTKPILAFLIYIAFVVSFMALIILFQKSKKLQKISFIYFPVKDAITDNCWATPTGILQKLNSDREFKIIQYLLNSFKNLRTFHHLSTTADQ